MKKIRDYIQAFFRQTDSPQYVEDEDFISDSKKALLSKTTPISHIILYTILILFLVGLIWSYFATIEQITIGTGKVIPSSQVKVIQSLDGGIVGDILVHEGEIINQGQVLIRLDDTRYRSDYKGAYAKYIVLAATIARLQTEAQDKDTIDFPDEVKAHPKVISLETKLFETRKRANQEELGTLRESYANAKKQTAMFGSLLSKGYSSKLEYLRSQQNESDIKTRILAKENEFREQVKADLTKNEGDMKSLIEQIQTLRDKMVRTTILSPVYGVVKKINIVTVGGVISPGMDIMEIVPLTDTLLIQAKVKPSDIAFIKIGQPATVKITAYDYSIYGSLPGTVEYISADTVVENNQKNSDQTAREPEGYYVVNVRVKRNYLGSEHHKLFIIPGMIATVHIKTGVKTILQYLLKPLIKAKEEALRER